MNQITNLSNYGSLRGTDINNLQNQRIRLHLYHTNLAPKRREFLLAAKSDLFPLCQILLTDKRVRVL